MTGPRFLPLSDVRLTGDGAFARQQAVDARFLLDVDADRLLVPFRREAGLPAKAEAYGGWESRDINGHSLGHYLSALAYLYAATGDGAVKARVDYIVDELAACQDAEGALLPVPRRIFDDVRQHKIDASPFSLNGAWVPFYTLHKLFAGLRDAYRQCGNARALEIERRLGAWVADVLAPLSSEEMDDVLRAEHGGMSEAFADLAADTGDGRFLAVSELRFNQKSLLTPLIEGRDELDGLHGNTQIPKLIGVARQYELSGLPIYRHAVETFWNAVVNDRSFAMGGHGESEHFFPPRDFPRHLTPLTAETCNTYNMLKLTRHLFAWQPDARQMNFVERALINHLLANIGRRPGEFGYFLGLAAPAVKVFSEPCNAWWCCVGTGMENPPRYGESIYAIDDDALWVNLFLASVATWRERGITVEQATAFPDGDTTRLTIRCDAPAEFTLELRHPYWCERMTIAVNGESMTSESTPSSYASIRRTWRDGDVVDVGLPMTLRLESLPHSDGKLAAVMYGPLMLVGLMTPDPSLPDPAKRRFGEHLDARGKTDGFAPVLVADDAAALLAAFEPTGQFAEFASRGVVRPDDLTFVPIHRVYEEHYAAYFAVMTPADWGERQAALVAQHRADAAREAATLDRVTPGFQQPEVEHKLAAQISTIDDLHNRKGRRAASGGFLSYEIRVDPEAPATLVATYWGSEWHHHRFDVRIDGETIATQLLRTNRPGEFFDVAYAIPPALTRGKRRVTVRFEPHAGSVAGPLYGLRVVRGEAADVGATP